MTWTPHLPLTLLCLWFAVTTQGQTAPPFNARIHQWQSQDSLMIREEHQLKTKKLQASRLSTQELLEWAETTALLDDTATWNQHFSRMDSLLQVQIGPWEAHLGHFRVLQTACKIPPPSGYDDENDKALNIWALFHAQLKQTIGQLGKGPIQHDASQRALSPPAVISWNSALIALFLGLLFAGATIWQAIKEKQSKDPARIQLRNPLLIDVRQKITHGKPDPHQVIQIDYVELKLGLSLIQTLWEKDKRWSRLNHSDLTLLHLILRGHSMATCAEFTGKTAGHVYNQRSKLRKLLDVPPEAQFSSYIKEAVLRS